MKILIWFISLAALALALAVAAAGPGTRFGAWDYGTGLTIIRTVAMPALIAAVAAALAFVLALAKARSIALLPLIALVAAGTAAMVPVKMKSLFEGNPFIHDVTTDFSDPPAIVAAANEERKNPPHYVGDEPEPRNNRLTSEAQKAAFPDIKTMQVARNVEDASTIATSVVTDMGMKLLHAGPAEDGWVIEAADTSMWFGFVDDFIVRIRPDGDGAIVDIRSKSRVGGSDLGANAKRIRTFMEKFETAV